MKFISNLIANKRLKENQAEKIRSNMSEVSVVPFKLIGVSLYDTSILEVFGPIVGTQKIIQRISTMAILVNEELSELTDIIRCGIKVLPYPKDNRYILYGSIGKFYNYAYKNIESKQYTKLVTFVCASLASETSYDNWHFTQQMALSKFLAAEVPHASEEELNVIKEKYGNWDDLLMIEFQDEDPERRLAIAISEEYIVTQDCAVCFISRDLSRDWPNSRRTVEVRKWYQNA